MFPPHGIRWHTRTANPRGLLISGVTDSGRIPYPTHPTPWLRNMRNRSIRRPQPTHTSRQPRISHPTKPSPPTLLTPLLTHHNPSPPHHTYNTQNTPHWGTPQQTKQQPTHKPHTLHMLTHNKHLHNKLNTNHIYLHTTKRRRGGEGRATPSPPLLFTLNQATHLTNRHELKSPGQPPPSPTTPHPKNPTQAPDATTPHPPHSA